jgi:DNA-binding GntR family transcriptional regulator
VRDSSAAASATLPDAIYDELRHAIIDQSFPPGSTITEGAVALRFGVARPTAKMAIEKLVTEGLLRRPLHHAAKVPLLDRDDIVDLFNNRAVIEVAAIDGLAAIGVVPAAAMLAHRALHASAANNEPFAEHDIAFHRALVDGQSPRLARMHALLMGEIELCIGQVQAERLIEATNVAAQHQSILDAVVSGDVELARERMRSHIHGSRDALLTYVDSRTLAGQQVDEHEVGVGQ